ncbi:hypothetical protein K502DRAFT_349036 [Neoconidiobolus thromboides FSU 785]|nr:hypothetical protein K502DRAFT_349036 [Neoconidiobolus thromboides FSU 785]
MVVKKQFNHKKLEKGWVSYNLDFDVADEPLKNGNVDSNKTSFRAYQKKYLLRCFKKDSYPDSQDIYKIAIKLKVLRYKVDTWFQNMSQKHVLIIPNNTVSNLYNYSSNLNPTSYYCDKCSGLISAPKCISKNNNIPPNSYFNNHHIPEIHSNNRRLVNYYNSGIANDKYVISSIPEIIDKYINDCTTREINSNHGTCNDSYNERFY